MPATKGSGQEEGANGVVQPKSEPREPKESLLDSSQARSRREPKEEEQAEALITRAYIGDKTPTAAMPKRRFAARRLTPDTYYPF